LFTYSQVIYPIVELKCQGCHSGSQPSAGLALLGYTDIRNIALSGALLSSLQGTDGFVQMPLNGASLPSCEVEQIQMWIAAGAPND
jgi:hypothetical protein